MKKILFLLSIISLLACSDDFLDRNQESVLTRDNILATKPSCEAALHSIYVKTMFNRVNYYNVSMQEARADMLNYRRDGYSDFKLIFDYNQGLADNGASRNSWIDCYGIIDACNLIINNDLTGLDDPLDPNSNAVKLEKADYEAQARVARAATYMDLLSYYSRPVNEANRDAEHSGVPLVLVNDYDLRPARATTMDVYRQIFEDLMFAVENLKIEHDAAGLTFSKAYAHGLLARFYMNLAGPVGSSNTYQLAESGSITTTEALTKAIESCDFVLGLVQPVDDFIDLEYGISRKLDETILMSITLVDDMDHSVHAKHWDINNDDAGDVLRVSKDVINDFSIADKRLSYFYHPEAWKNNGVEGDDLATRLTKSSLDGEGNEMIGAAMYGKFASKDFAVNLRDFFFNPKDVEIDYTSGFGDFNIMRASEIALIKAEACARSGQSSLAFDAYASVKQRYFDDALPGGVTLEEILLEKRLEFIGEGIRMLDLLRLGQNFSRYESTNSVVKDVDFNSNRLILPLPDTDVKNNTNLKQNPGYDN